MEVRLNHLFDEIREKSTRFPAKHVLGFGGVALQKIHFRRSIEDRIDFHMVSIVQSDMGERDFAEFPNAVSFPSRNNVIAGFGLLQHEVHCGDVVRRMSPISARIKVSKPNVLRQS